MNTNLTSPRGNVFIGDHAGYANTTGGSNTAMGTDALFANTTGSSNTAIGREALRFNTTGSLNTAMGRRAMYQHTTGTDNTAIGSNAGGFTLNQTNSTFLGSAAYASTGGLTNVTGIGYNARPTDSNRIHIGNTSVSFIGGQVAWGTFSDERFKQNIREDVPGLDFVRRLHPVTYQYRTHDLAAFFGEDRSLDEEKSVDPQIIEGRNAQEAIRYTGFLAQEVESAARDLGYDFSGVQAPPHEHSIYSLRYAEFVVPLVKAVQELDAENENLRIVLNAQSAEIERLQKMETRLAALEATLATSGIAERK